MSGISFIINQLKYPKNYQRKFKNRMKIKYKNIEGELQFTVGGYYALDRDGCIYYPELIFLGQSNTGALYAYGAIISDNDDKGNIVILEEAELLNTLTLVDFIKYLKYEISMNRLDSIELTETASTIIYHLEKHDIRVFDNVKEYIRNKEYLKLLKQTNNE